MPSAPTSFDQFFERATGTPPFPFQRTFAGGGQGGRLFDLPTVVDVPTGLGKTAMAVLGWLWRRRFADQAVRRATPRRLVYCLPMRVLVEQTRENARRWISALKDANALDGDVSIYVLMGGEDDGDWDIHPERDAVIIGTQDMLLSRALNRGYAASRARWPMHFGVLNTDCLWVFDEIQLMGSGLATTTQLEAFRRSLGRGGGDGNGCRSVWMSATLRPEWLETVDYRTILNATPGTRRLEFRIEKEIEDPSISAGARRMLEDRWKAKKALSKASSVIDPKSQDLLAAEVVKAHNATRGRTFVVVNTVKRACDLLSAIKKKWSAAADENLILIHSRFRPTERKAQIEKLKAETPPEQLPSEGMIVVSTQVIEAGVDVSATTLFTELAPWGSLVQRFGRCNRRGEQNEHASVRWIDLPAKDADAEEVRFPYELDDLRAAAAQLKKLKDVGLGSLTKHTEDLEEKGRRSLFSHEHTHVIRRKDVLDLFDTTPDLAGNDIDIDRYVRDLEETDVRVFWRTWDQPTGNEPPPDDKRWRQVGREELCPAPIGEFRRFASKRSNSTWRWDYLEGVWSRPESYFPGQVYLVRANAGGYERDRGWRPEHPDPVNVLGPPVPRQRSEDEYDDDGLSVTDNFERIDQHTCKVCEQLELVLSGVELELSEAAALRLAARWHDLGKAHVAFQIKIDDGQERADKDTHGNPQFRRKREGKWATWEGCRVVAKAPGNRWKQQGDLADAGFWSRGEKASDGFRRHFRHELASALAVLQRPHDAKSSLRDLAPEALDLVAYLIAAHHGKVRLSIRSMPKEQRPFPLADSVGHERRFARGVWDGDELPGVDLGGGVTTPPVTLSLEPMELGLGEGVPVSSFRNQSSWGERILRLRAALGPFRLAYLEAILRAADERASAAMGESDSAGDVTRKNAAHA